MNTKYDVVIIGKGPAGISASLYLARAKRSVLVLGKDYGALERAEQIENYYGLAKPISGLELAQAGVAQAQNLGVLIKTDEVTQLEALFSDEGSEDSRFKITTAAGDSYASRSVLIATGKQRTGLKVAGFEEYQGRGISFCAVCDGFFYRGKKLGVIGSGSYAAAELNHLYALTRNISLFTDGAVLSPEVKDLLPPDISIVTEKITAIIGTAPAQDGGKVAAILTLSTENAEQGIKHPLDGIFVAIGTAGAADFAAKLGIETGSGANAGSIITDESGATAAPGLYAAGDASGGFLQVAKAVSDGALAAKAIITELKTASSLAAKQQSLTFSRG